MLCESCQAREATVHLALIGWPDEEMSKGDFCQECYPSVESERLKSYNLQPATQPLVIDFERITASEYLEAEARAKRNGVDMPAFRRIRRELDKLPDTRHRLGMELLTIALEKLERGEVPYSLIAFGIGFAGFGQDHKVSACAILLEKIISRLFDRLDQFPASPSFNPHASGLFFATVALQRLDPERFMAVMDALKVRCDGANQELRRKVLAEIEKRASKS